MPLITRRQVAAGAAWSVPVIALGAAAPAMAASGCPTIQLVGVTQATQGTQWAVQLTFLDFRTAAATYSGTVSLTQVNTSSGNSSVRTAPFSFTYDGAVGSYTFTVYLQRTGPSYVTDVTVDLTAPVVCQQTFVIPPPA